MLDIILATIFCGSHMEYKDEKGGWNSFESETGMVYFVIVLEKIGCITICLY